MFHFVYLFCIIMMLLLVNGCNDTPNSVGGGTANSGDHGIDYGVVHVDTFYTTGHSTVLNSYLYTSMIDRFMLGKYDSKAYEAWACLKFNTWPDSLLGVNITSATIKLKGLYHCGDSLAAFSFNVYSAKSNLFLTGDSLTYDSLYSKSDTYYNSSPLPIETVIPLGDTESVTIKILDTALIRTWFSTNIDTLGLNHGLVLQPTNSNIIKGFYSFNASDTAYQPTLFINYTNANGPNTYVHKLGSAKYVAKQEIASIKDSLIVQNGISYRGLIAFDSILTAWPVLMHSAVLEVTLNPDNSSPNFAHDSLFALSVGSDGISDGLYHALSKRTIDSYGHAIYSFDIMNVTLNMLTSTSVRKIGLSGYFESGSFDLHTFYGTASDKKVMPRLIIKYSTQR